MSSQQPKFVDSPYFVGEPGNWHLKPGAPKEIQTELEDFLTHDELGDLAPVPKLTAKDIVE